MNIAKFLLKLTLSFRGHDESVASLNRGIFIELLEYTRELDEEIHINTGIKASPNEKLTSSKIQKEIVQCYSKQTINAEGCTFRIKTNSSRKNRQSLRKL